MFGTVKPDDTVNLYFNLSTADDQKDLRGMWNTEPFDYVADPSPRSTTPKTVKNPDDEHKAPQAAE